MIHLTIDDKPIEIEAGRTLLEACREHGIKIPTLCFHPALEPYGGCRLCMVELVLPAPLTPGGFLCLPMRRRRRRTDKQ